MNIKRLLSLFGLVLCLVLCAVPVFADEEVTEPLPDRPATSTADTGGTIHSEDAGNTQVNVIIADNGVTGASTAEGETWMDGGSGDSLLEALFGPYRPYDATGLASVDWAWIADAVVFLVLLVCFFKIVGGVIKRV